MSTNPIVRLLQNWVCRPAKPMTGYEEICHIKDRLYQDIARLEQLQGTIAASLNVNAIASDVLGAEYFRRNSQ